jgi:hypothetical protein
VFDRGPLTNLGDVQADNNATQHALWSMVVGLTGYALAGRFGLRWACGAWSAESLVGEAFFHAPPGPLGPGYAAEVRTDLASKILPCLTLALVESLQPAKN